MSFSRSRDISKTSFESAQSAKINNYSENPSEIVEELESSSNEFKNDEDNNEAQDNGIKITVQPSPVKWRIFINHIDSYHGKKLAEILPECESIVDSQRDDENSENEVSDDDEFDDREREDEEDENNLKNNKSRKKRQKLEVIGTVKDENYKRPEDVNMIIRTTKNREVLIRALMKCGVVIYDITADDSQIEEATWALEAIVEELVQFRRDTPKAFERNRDTRYFILISTVMTWALTKPIDPENLELPLTEADYRKRKPHPNFKEHIKCEKMVATIAKRNELRDKLKTVVLGVGITYGDEEDPLHYLFKMAWHNADYLPIFGTGLNKIPLLHIRDLVEVVCMLIKKWPKLRYIVAVEQETVSQAIIVKKISKALTTGKVELVKQDEAFSFPELSQRSYDMINININIVPDYIIDNEINWHWEMPFRDNINYIVEEYKKSRNLYPLKLIILGPPASGKTFLAGKLAQHYQIHYLSSKNVIEDTVQKLTKEIEAAGSGGSKQDISKMDLEEEDEDENYILRVDNLQEELKQIRDNLTKNNGRLNDEILNKLFLKRLLSKDCQNQGYVLDGYPKTLAQAEALFESADNEENIVKDDQDISDVSTVGGNRKIMPELVIVLEASDDFLIERVISLPESEVQGTHYNEEGMIRRLRQYRERNTDDETPVQFFDEREIHPLFINVEDDTCPQMFSTFIRCIEKLGEPRNYGPSESETEEAKKRSEAEALAVSKMEEARKEREDLEKKREREEKMMEWTDMLEQLKEEEEEQLCVMAEPLRHYLVKYIFPILTKGLIEVANLRPEDPIDFLAEYLFRENPEGKMFEPDYTETMSVLLDTIEKFQEKISPYDELDYTENELPSNMEEKRQKEYSSFSNLEEREKTEEEEGEDEGEKKKEEEEESETLTDGDEEEEEEEEEEGDERERKMMAESIEVENSWEIEATISDEKNYVEESTVLPASSFSQEEIGEGSRTSFENSSNASL